MRRFVLIALLLATACGGPTEVAIDQDFTLAFGRSVAIENTGYTVTFQDVLQDSRCPVNADCVWAGNARIRLAINRPTRHVAVNTDLDPRHAVIAEAGIRQLVLQLEALSPLPQVDRPTNKDAYRATLRAVRWERLEGGQAR